jgi:hypothetical protein
MVYRIPLVICDMVSVPKVGDTGVLGVSNATDTALCKTGEEDRVWVSGKCKGGCYSRETG